MDSESHPFFDVVVLLDLSPGLLEAGGQVLEETNAIVDDVGFGIDIFLYGLGHANYELTEQCAV